MGMRYTAALPLIALVTWCCGSESGGPSIAPGPPSGVTGGASPLPPVNTGGTTSQPPTGAGGTLVQIGGSSGSGNQAGSPVACAAVRAETSLEPVFLAFAFDVSGSMGKGDEPWHDRTLKWEPVVAATRQFLEAPVAAGLTASMTFFPADGDEDERCEDATYTEPDVPMTDLPSPQFGTALDVIGAEDWRGGTPTLHVVRGTIAYVEGQRAQKPGKYAIVLVTDGYPQGCADDEITELASIVSGVAVEIPTYVIGVQNPPIDDAPDTTSNLESIAVAGGTEHAYLIDTGDPSRTAGAFSGAIDAIRGAAVACTVEIPLPPDGRVFDKESVVVRYQNGASSTSFAYDPTCSGETSWHYDDPASPTQIVLCESACNLVSGVVEAELEVEFACERVLQIPE
jgi:hypothetical protein